MIDLPDAAKKLAAEVASFADKHLGQPHVPRSAKVIHDALWGTQRLHIHEVALVDTPLFQRLRRLHQTGFSYLTYPSTTHTRFEHSLGVLYQTDKLARALHEKYRDLDSNLVTLDKIRELRVAALLHDCSHGPFSHTSEDIYSNFPAMQELIGPRGKGFEGSSASEVLAFFILTSDPFKQFLEKLKESVVLDVDPEWLSSVILGGLKNTDPLNAHYSEILNGPFDSDKLDYIFRDGHYSGLPLGVDLDRLWLATEIHKIGPSEVPGFAKPMRRLVMARAGINSLEQIVAARMNLTRAFITTTKSVPVTACSRPSSYIVSTRACLCVVDELNRRLTFFTLQTLEFSPKPSGQTMRTSAKCSSIS